MASTDTFSPEVSPDLAHDSDGAIKEDAGEARRFLSEPEAAGVDQSDVAVVLEKEGAEKFADSFGELIVGMKDTSGKVVG